MSQPDPSEQHRLLGFDLTRFENTRQIGGIQLAQYAPAFGGDLSRPVRVAQCSTGSGLRFDVALDRGGDIIGAWHNEHGLTYLSPVGLEPPSHAFNREGDWLANWPGGLLTTCGPRWIGHPRIEHGESTSLHGRHSNRPASVEMLVQPDLHRGRRELMLGMLIRDARTMGPVYEVHRTIRSVLGGSRIALTDQVMNRSDQRQPHHWLYHVNLGYPLLNDGARFVYRGEAEPWRMPEPFPGPLTADELAAMKVASGPLPEHAGAGERGMIVRMTPDDRGYCAAGLVNEQIGLGVALVWRGATLPRMANWQHYGPGGTYVTALEPFHGSLLGLEKDHAPDADTWLEPGESRAYQLDIDVLTTPQACQAFIDQYDGPVRPA